MGFSVERRAWLKIRPPRFLLGSLGLGSAFACRSRKVDSLAATPLATGNNQPEDGVETKFFVNASRNVLDNRYSPVL
jgi:hypothetical protein